MDGPYLGSGLHAGNGRFWDFCTCYVPFGSKKLSVQCQCDGNFWSSTNHKIVIDVRKFSITPLLSFESVIEQNARWFLALVKHNF